MGHRIASLVPSLAQFLHEQWILEVQEGGWKYGPNHGFTGKTDPWCVPYSKLPNSASHMRILEAVILVKCVLACGFFLKPLDQCFIRNKKGVKR